MKLSQRLLAAILIVPLTLGLGSPTALAASQTTITSPDDLDQALAERLASEQRSRRVIRSLLRHAQIAVVADDLGLDLRRAEDAVSSLEGAELETLAEQAQRAHSALSATAAGGSGGHFSSWPSIVLLVLLVGLLILVIAEPL